MDALRLRKILDVRQIEEGAPLFQDDLDHLVQAYEGAVRYVDTQFGMFMTELQNRDLLDQSLIVVLSDHGRWEYSMGAITDKTVPRLACTVDDFRYRARSQEVAELVRPLLLSISCTHLNNEYRQPGR